MGRPLYVSLSFLESMFTVHSVSVASKGFAGDLGLLDATFTTRGGQSTMSNQNPSPNPARGSLELGRQPDIRAYRGKHPQIAASAYIDPAAGIIGDVVIGEDSSVWPCSVIRGEVHHL